MKYLVCVKGAPQRVRAGVWFTNVASEYELTKEQAAAVEADPMLVAKLASAPASVVAPKEKKPSDK